MIYTRWGNRNNAQLVSRLGFGTTRFKTCDLLDNAGLNRCVELVYYAISKGINYFDVAPTYSYGLAEKILGKAFKEINKPIYIAAKTGLAIDRNSDDLLRRLDTSLKTLSKDHIDFYHIWSVMDLNQYKEILKPNGLYEGALKAKEKGLIKNLCISLHCDVETVLKIINEDLFDGITISMNALNYRKWLPVINAAKKHKMGVVTMNSLAGGMIPIYSDLFESLDNSNDSIPVKALRFLSSFQQIDVELSGMQSQEQIDENCSAFDDKLEVEINKSFVLTTNQPLCSGCNYCSPCSVNIPISSCMQAYNHKILIESSNKNIEAKQLANEIFTRIRANGVKYEELNKCLSCHKCEKKCTQKINISERLKELENTAYFYGYNKELMLKRLTELELECKNSKNIAIWPACDYASRLFDFWQNKDFENKCKFFNASPAMVGKTFRGKIIYGLEDLVKQNIDVIVITHYTMKDEICCYLETRIPKTIKIIKLHNQTNCIDWFY